MSGYAADVVVVGSGMGGAFAALELSRVSRKSILVLESGGFPEVVPPAGFASRIVKRLMRRSTPGGHRWPGMLHVQAGDSGVTRVFHNALGHGVGGSGAIYGAALGRFRRSDFEEDGSTTAPSGPWGEALPNDWPVSAAAMLRAYDRAESLLGVVGERDPLEEGCVPALPPADLSARDRHITQMLRQHGGHPYRLPVGIDYGALAEGAADNDARRYGWNCGLQQAVKDGRLTLRTGAHVTAIERVGAGFRLHLSGGASVMARQVVLAAGALTTPRILMASPALFAGRVPEMLGRGLMFHKSDLLFTRACGDESPIGPRKSIALRDGYRLPSGRSGGEVQSLPVHLGIDMIAEILRREGGASRALATTRVLRRLPGQMARIGRGARSLTLFATILEDLPYTGNRVLPADTPGPGDIRIMYKEPDELRERQEELRAVIRTLFGPAGVGFLSMGEEQMNWGHPCGTCRMGRDPASSVTDAEGRLHGVEGIRIADASTFASSAGTNPALTVVAQAIRVAEAMAAG